MASKNVTVNLSKDAEARPVAMIVQIASQFESKVYIIDKNKKINAKSIMGMMSLGFGNGTELTVEAEGIDAESAVQAVADYIEAIK
ncbi:MAG: HPr family phosphocarrier protein [Lachnospiraceae bacterium]|nr:HPr family phosphocarrier protein [Lachnospiraceae bacterium]